MQLQVFYSELYCCLNNIGGADADSRILWVEEPTENQLIIANAIITAHEKPLYSKECKSLQKLLTEEQWIAYQDARKQPIREQRAARYKNEADPVYLKAVEDSARDTKTLDISEWLKIKDKIRNDLPYPD